MAGITQRINDIENAITARLNSGGLSVREFDISDEPAHLPASGANIALWDGTIRPVSKTTWRMNGVFYVTVVLKNIKDEKARRHGVYPVIMSAVQLLAGKELSLDGGTSSYPVQPRRVRRVLNTTSRIAFTIELQIPVVFEMTDDDADAADIMKIALNYMLKGGEADETDGDDIADAQDIVEIT